MSIQALPAGTVRAISASQVLADPSSVVKELIDNALDAHASAISIEISANTLDVIQLRDNGHGIAPEDRALVCRRHYTSKIRGLEDLKAIGGSSLGFRGEALASAAELAGGLVVTTRVEGEDIAVALKVDRMGEVIDNERASHPVGTTVRLTSLFEHLPVRKQTALKVTQKTLVKLKRLIQHYAFARPLVRFSLRILKAKNNKGDWMYAPKQDGALEDAALKIVGKECATQCMRVKHEHDGFEIQAFLPRVDADVPKINNIGQFVSVDQRPVVTTRCVLKQLVTRLRERLKAASGSFGDVKHPFAWIMIICPSESYDANVEPAKDDLVFEDGPKLMSIWDDLLEQHYPKAKDEDHPTEGPTTEPLSPVELMPPLGNSRPEVSSNAPLIDLERPLERPSKRARSPDVANHTDENAEGGNRSHGRDSNERGDEDITYDSLTANPWTLSKTRPSARLRRTGSARNGQLLTPLHERSSGEANSTSGVEIIDVQGTNQRPSSSIAFPANKPWQPPSPRSSPLRHRGQLEQQERQSQPTKPVPELEPTDSVSVAGSRNALSVDDDIDPSLAHLYQPQQHPARPTSKRWKGWQIPQIPHHRDGEDTVSDEYSDSTQHSSLGHGQRTPLAQPDRRTNAIDEPTMAEDEGPLWFPRSNLNIPGPATSSPGSGGAHALGGSGKRKRQGDMDIRQAFGFGTDDSTATNQSTVRKGFKSFKPDIPLRRPRQEVRDPMPQPEAADGDQSATTPAPSIDPFVEHLVASSSNETGDVDPTVFANTLSHLPNQAHGPRSNGMHHQRPATYSAKPVLYYETVAPKDVVHNLSLTLPTSTTTLAAIQRTEQDLDLTLASGSVSVGAFSGCEPFDPLGRDVDMAELGCRTTLLEPPLGEEEVGQWAEAMSVLLPLGCEDGTADDVLRGELAGGIAAALEEHAPVSDQGVAA